MLLPSTAVLKIADFRCLMLTRMFVTFALQSQAVIVGWQVYDLTKDPLMLGLTGLAEAIPAILSAFYAGHVVDISNPKKIYRLCLMALVVNTLILFMIAGGHVDTPLNTPLLAWIFIGIIASGLIRAFIMPASFSLLPLVVERPQIQSASAWMNSFFQIAAVGGPALAGIIYAFYGVTWAWAMPIAMMSCALINISFLMVIPPPREHAQKPSTLQNIRAGWAFILSKPVLLSVMTLDMFAVLLGGAVAMLPAFTDEILKIGPEGLGLLRAAPAIGAVLTAIIFALYPMKHLSGAKLLFVVAGFGCCMIGFGFSTSFWVALIFLALSGAFDSVSVIIRSTLMQLLTPDHMRGRVSSVNSMFIISSNEIGAFESGVAARVLGLVPSIIFGGFGTLLVVGVTSLLSPGLRRIVVDQHGEHHHK